jgi:hypothetical protein
VAAPHGDDAPDRADLLRGNGGRGRRVRTQLQVDTTARRLDIFAAPFSQKSKLNVRCLTHYGQGELRRHRGDEGVVPLYREHPIERREIE